MQPAISLPIGTIVNSFKYPFERAMAAGNVHVANVLAMQAAKFLFEHDPDRARMIAWKEFFAPLGKRHYRAQYQCFDFEVVDYELHSIPQSWSLLRGPRPSLADLAAGRYLTFIGAAQLFGRYQAVAPPLAVADSFALACLNLASGGAGPETFFADDIVELANGGRAVVVQILSGRSIGCDEYPGTRFTFRPDSPKDKIDRLKLLREIWAGSRQEAKRLARKWQSRYVDTMQSFLRKIDVPIILAWISTRRADEWSVDRLDVEANFGSFPQLVEDEMVRELRPFCSELVEASRDSGLPHGFTSRFTGQQCPVLQRGGAPLWENDYYPSAAVGAEMTSKMKGALGEVLGTGPG